MRFVKKAELRQGFPVACLAFTWRNLRGFSEISLPCAAEKHLVFSIDFTLIQSHYCRTCLEVLADSQQAHLTGLQLNGIVLGTAVHQLVNSSTSPHCKPSFPATATHAKGRRFSRNWVCLEIPSSYSGWSHLQPNPMCIHSGLIGSGAFFWLPHCCDGRCCSAAATGLLFSDVISSIFPYFGKTAPWRENGAEGSTILSAESLPHGRQTCTPAGYMGLKGGLKKHEENPKETTEGQ